MDVACKWPWLQCGYGGMNLVQHENKNSFKAAFFPVICIYRILLDIGYYSAITKKYAYTGFQDNRNSILLILSWVVLLCSYIIVKRILTSTDNRTSVLIITILYLINFVPFTSCVYAGLYDTGYIIANCVYWSVLILAQYVSLHVKEEQLPKMKLGVYAFDERVAWALGICSLLLVLFISGRYAHFRLNFNLFSVYDIRYEARTYKFPTIISYLFAWTRAINPVLLAYSLLKKKRWMAIMFFLTQMLSFGIDGLKSTFFMPFLVLLVVFFYNKISPQKLKLYFTGGVTFFALVSVLEHIVFHSSMLLEIIVRRVMYVPNYLGYCYYDFFQSNVPDYFRGSFLRHFGFSSPYAEKGGISFAIGLQYFKRTAANCNTGLIADAMTNLGMMGLIIMPVLLILILRLFDRSTINLDKRLSIATTLYFSNLLMNSFLLTVLLTHGMIVLIVMLSIINSNEMS